MIPEISLIAIGTDGTVIGATEDAYQVRIEQAPDAEGLRLVTVTGPGYSETERVHTANIGLAKARAAA